MVDWGWACQFCKGKHRYQILSLNAGPTYVHDHNTNHIVGGHTVTTQKHVTHLLHILAETSQETASRPWSGRCFLFFLCSLLTSFWCVFHWILGPSFFGSAILPGPKLRPKRKPRNQGQSRIGFGGTLFRVTSHPGWAPGHDDHCFSTQFHHRMDCSLGTKHQRIHSGLKVCLKEVKWTFTEEVWQETHVWQYMSEQQVFNPKSGPHNHSVSSRLLWKEDRWRQERI